MIKILYFQEKELSQSSTATKARKTELGAR